MRREGPAARGAQRTVELIVIGGGPAGLAAACAAYEGGLRDILIIERDRELGGILNQCVHSGFGLHYFRQELTGPEYAGRFTGLLRGTGAEALLDTMALEVTPRREVHVVSPAGGYRVLRARAVVLAMGCRERARGAVTIPGTRPAGVFTAGAAQRLINMEGYRVGERAVILGSGDIGLIMARRMTLEGARVLACIEIMPYSGGLQRNIAQCLEDFGIPLYLSHTIVEVRGRARVEGVVMARVDAQRRPVPGTEREFACDTVLLSVGLIPENELTRGAGIEMDARTNGAAVFENMETSLPGVFACGNAAHVHDLVDFVTEEGRRAGAAAARAALGGEEAGDAPAAAVRAGEGVAYAVPQKIRPSRLGGETCDVFFRARRVFSECLVTVRGGSGEILARYPRERVAPGEMERIALPAALLAGAGGWVSVDILEGEGGTV